MKIRLNFFYNKAFKTGVFTRNIYKDEAKFSVDMAIFSENSLNFHNRIGDSFLSSILFFFLIIVFFLSL